MMQMWNLHSQCPLASPPARCLYTKHQPGQRGHGRCPGPCLEPGRSGVSRSAGTSPRRALGVRGGRGLSFGWGLSCWNPAASLGFPTSAFLAPWLRHPRGRAWEEQLDANQSSFLFLWLHPDAFQGQFHQ